MRTTKIYAQAGHPTKKLFLDNEVKDAKGMTEFMRAHQGMVKQCHDFLPIGLSDGKFYLPNRKKGNAISDISGVWFIGGAMIPFVSEEESMRKVLKRETGFDIKLSRLKYLCRNRYYMNGKAQGGLAHDARCDVYALPLTKEEIASIKLDPGEYEGGSLQPYGIREIEAIADPFVRVIFFDLWYELNVRIPTLDY